MDHFSADEVAYLEFVHSEVDRASAAFESYRTFLSGKYKLSERDRYLRDGTILRSVPAPVTLMDVIENLEQLDEGG